MEQKNASSPSLVVGVVGVVVISVVFSFVRGGVSEGCPCCHWQ